MFLLTGIIVANVLLAGTLLINAQARSSYAQGEQYLNASPVGQIRQKDGTRKIDESDYVSLRRRGFDMLAPLLRYMVRSENGEVLETMLRKLNAWEKQLEEPRWGPGASRKNSKKK